MLDKTIHVQCLLNHYLWTHYLSVNQLRALAFERFFIIITHTLLGKAYFEFNADSSSQTEIILSYYLYLALSTFGQYASAYISNVFRTSMRI